MNNNIKYFIENIYYKDEGCSKTLNLNFNKFGISEEQFWEMLKCLSKIFNLEDELANVSDSILLMIDSKRVEEYIWKNMREDLILSFNGKELYFSSSRFPCSCFCYYYSLPVFFGCIQIWKLMSSFYSNDSYISSTILFPHYEKILRFNKKYKLNKFAVLIICKYLNKLIEQKIDIENYIFMKSLKKFINTNECVYRNEKFLLISPSLNIEEYEISKDIISIILKK
jgi:hypothetical protein